MAEETLTTIVFKVVTASGNAPVADADVVAFVNFNERVGAQGKSNKAGEVKLTFRGQAAEFERVYVYPKHSAWPMLRKNHPAANTLLKVVEIDLAFKDSLRTAYAPSKPTDGKKVTIGVIDTGVGPHNAVSIQGGANTVQGEVDTDWADSDHHGTHVAGIIAANSAGFSGVASGAAIRAYRVFGKGEQGASNFAIAKAIDRAVADRCDLLNLSLGGGGEDPLISDAIKAARSLGVICVIAAGNDGAKVAWPGKHPLAICVSAIGIKGTWPQNATQNETVTSPLGNIDAFLASFSNRGPEIDLSGPGVGIISTIPSNLYAVLDGTSMACPAVTGAIARKLANAPEIADMPRDAARADAIVSLALTNPRDLGLSAEWQGAGLA